MDMGMIGQSPSPGVKHSGKTWKAGADKSWIFDNRLDCGRRSLEQRAIGCLLVRPTERSDLFRHRKCQHRVLNWQRFVKLHLKPTLCFVILTLGTMPVAT